MAYGFSDSPVANLKVNIDYDSDGTIAASSEVAAAAKAFNLKGFKADGTLEQANAVWSEILGNIGGASYDSLTAVKTRADKVEEVE